VAAERLLVLAVCEIGGGAREPFLPHGLKIAVVAPIPRASISTAVAAKAGSFQKIRLA